MKLGSKRRNPKNSDSIAISTVCQGLVDGVLKATDRNDLLFTQNEWDILAGVVSMLKPFDEVTTVLSSQFYTSISKIIPSIKILQHNHKKFIRGCPILENKMNFDVYNNNSIYLSSHSTESSR